MTLHPIKKQRNETGGVIDFDLRVLSVKEPITVMYSPEVRKRSLAAFLVFQSSLTLSITTIDYFVT